MWYRKAPSGIVNSTPRKRRRWLIDLKHQRNTTSNNQAQRGASELVRGALERRSAAAGGLDSGAGARRLDGRAGA
jgi:hypothetical protein